MFQVPPAPIIRSTQTVVTTTGTGHEFEDAMIKSDYKESMDEQLELFVLEIRLYLNFTMTYVPAEH
jgi:hypothetical protein